MDHIKMQWRGPRRGWSWSVATDGHKLAGREATRSGTREAIRAARKELNRTDRPEAAPDPAE